MTAVLVWFRRDLRLRDNPALSEAVRLGHAVIPVFIEAFEEEGAWAPGGASRFWLHQSLAALDRDLQKAGLRLILRKGPSLKTLTALRKETGAAAVFWNRIYEPAFMERDKLIKTELRAAGLQAESFPGNVLHEPWAIRNKQGEPYKVFTPFWNTLQAMDAPARPLPVPPKFQKPLSWPGSLKLDALGLEPKIRWAEGIRKSWTPGEAGAEQELDRFFKDGVADYTERRDLPAETGTSRLSPHLHFGEISPRTVWHALARHKKALPYLRQIVWREFAHHLLYHFPHTPLKNLRPEFDAFPWQPDRKLLRAWQKGRTGYPIVDAGMRELWTSGWMHNRVRMVAASLLVKHLLIPWQEGARWFWDTLVDADLANNTMGWQWVAGSGADAAPYFRIFNPVSQGERFDPAGAYIRRWVPELAALPDKWIHAPWTAPEEVLQKAGIILGKSYPQPVISHELARRRALMAYEKMRKRPQTLDCRPKT